MDFLDRLRILMEQCGDNNSALAKKSEMPYTTIDGLFKRGWEKAQVSTIRRICECYNVSMDYMVRGAEGLSAEALLFAGKYETLNAAGRELISIVMSYALNHNKEDDDLPEGVSVIKAKRIPLIGEAVCDGAIEARQAAAYERAEAVLHKE